jgi:uncharacterized protein with PQ loop repeat
MHGFHHLRKRMRAMRGVEPFPSRSILVRVLDYFMYFVGIVSPLALLPQIVQIYSTKGPAGVSFLTWSLLTIASVLWTIYAVVHKDKLLLFASALMVVFHLMIVVGLWLY